MSPLHRIDYHVTGAGTGSTQYAAVCRACGWSHVSWSPTDVSKAGPQHTLDAWDREHAA